MHRSSRCFWILVACTAAAWLCGCGNPHSGVSVRKPSSHIKQVDATENYAHTLHPASAANPSPRMTHGKARSSPYHEFLYVIDTNQSSIRSFAIQASGELTPVGKPFVRAGGEWDAIAGARLKRMLYVVGAIGGNLIVDQFRIRQDGTLKQLPSFPLNATRSADDMVVEHRDKYLRFNYSLFYKNHPASKAMLMHFWAHSYTICKNGTLQTHAEQHVMAGPLFSPPGSFNYRVSSDDATLFVSRVRQDGSLKLLSSQKLTGVPNGDIYFIITTVARGFAYIGFWDNDDGPTKNDAITPADESGWPINIYRIGKKGALTLIGTSSMTGAQPIIHADPLGRFLYVASIDTAQIFTYRILPNGQLRQIGLPLSDVYAHDFVIMRLAQ